MVRSFYQRGRVLLLAALLKYNCPKSTMIRNTDKWYKKKESFTKTWKILEESLKPRPRRHVEPIKVSAALHSELDSILRKC